MLKNNIACLMILLGLCSAAKGEEYRDESGFYLPYLRKLYLFSHVDGIVTLGGKPLEGVLVKQEYYYHWDDVHGVNTTRTAADGTFSFPVVTTRSGTATLLPHEEITNQRLRFVYENVEYDGWYHSKHNFNNLGEIQRPLRLYCDLKQPKKAHEELQSFGICSEWKQDESPDMQ